MKTIVKKSRRGKALSKEYINDARNIRLSTYEVSKNKDTEYREISEISNVIDTILKVGSIDKYANDEIIIDNQYECDYIRDMIRLIYKVNVNINIDEKIKPKDIAKRILYGNNKC